MQMTVIKEQELLGKQFKIYGDFENPLFLAKDIASWIGLTNVTDMISRVDTDEVTKLNLGGLQGDCNFLTENGLYEVLMQSRKPIAKEFKKQVKVILKDIRKHGVYATDKLLENPDLLIGALQKLKEEREVRKQLEDKIESQKTKVLFAETIETAKTSILVGELAKIIKQSGYDIGAQRMFDWLRDNGYLIKRAGSDRNMPTQKSMDLGLFEIKEGTRASADGSIHITKTPKVTGKGQVYFINKFLAIKEAI